MKLAGTCRWRVVEGRSKPARRCRALRFAVKYETCPEPLEGRPLSSLSPLTSRPRKVVSELLCGTSRHSRDSLLWSADVWCERILSCQSQIESRPRMR